MAWGVGRGRRHHCYYDSLSTVSSALLCDEAQLCRDPKVLTFLSKSAMDSILKSNLKSTLPPIFWRSFGGSPEVVTQFLGLGLGTGRRRQGGGAEGGGGCGNLGARIFFSFSSVINGTNRRARESRACNQLTRLLLDCQGWDIAHWGNMNRV